jgi:hypothetical protein
VSETQAEAPDETEAEPGPETEGDEEEAEEAAEEEAAPAPEPTPEPGGLSVEKQRKMFDTAGKRAETYREAVRKALGPLFQDLQACPRCLPGVPGYYLPTTMVPVDVDQRDAVLISIAMTPPPTLNQDPQTRECTTCGGWGKVATGSHVPRQAELACADCDGRGWVGPRSAREPSAAATQAGNGYVPEAGSVESSPQVDPWGRTLDHPDYGVMPGFERH